MPTRTVKRAFTLIEILIVVVILGILAAIVIPQFTDASQEAMESSVRSQLQTIRGQIELYNVQNPNSPYDAATPLVGFWAPLVEGSYLQGEPKNPLQSNSTSVADAAADTVGWVWAEASAGDAWTLNIYAVDENDAMFVDPDGNPW